MCLRKFVKWVTNSLPVRKSYIEQMFGFRFSAHAILQPCGHTTSETFRKGYAIYIYDIKFGTLQVRNNDISLRKCSGGSADLRTLKGTLVTKVCAIW